MAFYRSYHKEVDYSYKYKYTCIYTGDNYVYQTAIEPLYENASIDYNNFNYPVVIGNNVNSLLNLYRNCLRFNRDITIPRSVNNCTGMLADCPNFGANIYIDGLDGYNSYKYFSQMLYNKNLSKRVNIFSNGLLSNTQLNSLMGMNYDTNHTTWSNMTNGVYNSRYNIYVYSNYTN